MAKSKKTTDQENELEEIKKKQAFLKEIKIHLDKIDKAIVAYEEKEEMANLEEELNNI